jgi:hypothetical protein
LGPVDSDLTPSKFINNAEKSLLPAEASAWAFGMDSYMENHKSQSFLVLMAKKARGFYFFRPNADAVSAIAVRNDSKKWSSQRNTYL